VRLLFSSKTLAIAVAPVSPILLPVLVNKILEKIGEKGEGRRERGEGREERGERTGRERERQLLSR
jgi:hypothetical protein